MPFASYTQQHRLGARSSARALVALGGLLPEVAPPAVASVTVSPATVTVNVDAQTQLTATPKTAGGVPIAGLGDPSWISSNTAIATVDAAGRVTGVAAGTCTITATISSVSGTAAATVQAVTGAPAGFFVSTTGTSGGTGAIGSPWDLQTALAHPAAVSAGDTIWVRGGLYDFGGDAVNDPVAITINGTSGSPITVRAYPGERATIDGNLSMAAGAASYCILHGLEIKNSNGTVTLGEASIGVSSHGIGCKVIHCVIHGHPGDGIGLWEDGTDQEAFGNIIYNCGWNGNNGSFTGHGIYSQNNTGSTKRIADNLIFDVTGYGVHIYGVDGHLIGYTIEGNAIANQGTMSTSASGAAILVGGGTAADAITVTENMTYHTEQNAVALWMGHAKDVQNGTLTLTDNYCGNGYVCIRVYDWTAATVTGNTFYAPDGNGSMTDIDGDTSGWTWSGNTYYGTSSAASWLWSDAGTNHGGTLTQFKAGTGLASGESYAGTTPPDTVFVRASDYESGRGNIVVYNWSGASSVDVPLSSVLTSGDTYEIKSALDFFGAAVASGTYDGTDVTIPMPATTGPDSIADNATTAPAFGPTFGMFVVLTTSTAAATTSAVRFDGTTNKLTTSAASGNVIDITQPFTLCGMLRIPATLTVFSAICNVHIDNHNLLAIEIDTSGHVIPSAKVANTTGTTGSSTATVSTGSYVQIALIRTASDTVDAYIDGTLAKSGSIPAGTFGAGTILAQLGDYDGTGELIKADFAYWRMWQSALTTTELSAEAASATPVKSGCLHAWPLQGASDLADTVGSFDFTATGTVTTTDGPTLS